MREVSEKCRDLLASGVYSVEWAADLLYDNDPKVQNLRVLEPAFKWDRGAQVQGSGSCQILWDDVFGESIVPRDIGDLFSPFGAELQVDVIVSAGAFRERISMGRFVLDSVPDGVEYAIERVHGGLPLVAESRVSLSLADYFMRIARDSFAFPASPQSTSMWEEAQRLTGLPVFRSIVDRVLPANITYEEDRLDALEKVFAPSNAWPHLTPSGALTALPKAWADPVGVLDRALSVSSEMRSENVYNRVVTEGKNPDPNGPPLIAWAEIRDGFLRTRNEDGSRSPFAGNTFQYRSDFLVTQAQCQAYADELLPKVARLRSVTRRVKEPFNPLREVGDVLTLVDPTRQGELSTVRVIEVAYSGGETVLNVEVAE
ncbi:hypothetical protein FGL91_18640 [Microbacterium sp. CBA3102]|uniref:hypothetical protein n=1 Tax=Microbacterium sp. CBA3102 TaxID=2603598 RepID=UPI0011BB2760|nr:hypothetical protein [Microbacterium sp. CBA3102]QEA30387.1 hypothetical protein FGL91_18640 [Microbacterium sp. CBA3102]